ncbi:MAG: tRNA-dihydrouridine synthase family protein [Butyrivibrio sp.]|nr:tRNA-dihydrouridine synthase family protein [Butyrivibrio sp.]
MKISFAPLEGITIYCYRNMHHMLFPEGLDRYYTPFISVYKHQAFKKRDMREILPENNKGLEGKIIPQIMTSKADEIVWALKEMKKRGYDEINLNMGCPVATVVSKHKGSGMLADPDHLDEIFYEVFESGITDEVKLSVKTRLGLTAPEEFKELLPVLNKYRFSNVIIHPRVRTQMYKGEPNMEIFRWAYENSKNPISYNGNIFTAEDFYRIKEDFEKLEEIMIGRGLVANPALVREVSTGKKASGNELKALIEGMEGEYTKEIPTEIQIMHKMKELWFYMGPSFTMQDGGNSERLIHKILVSKSISEYRNAKRELFRKCVMD